MVISGVETNPWWFYIWNGWCLKINRLLWRWYLEIDSWQPWSDWDINITATNQNILIYVRLNTQQKELSFHRNTSNTFKSQQHCHLWCTYLHIQWFEPNMYVWDNMLKKGQPYSWVKKKTRQRCPSLSNFKRRCSGESPTKTQGTKIPMEAEWGFFLDMFFFQPALLYTFRLWWTWKFWGGKLYQFQDDYCARS